MVKGSRRQRTTRSPLWLASWKLYVSGPRLQTALREAGPEVSASYVGYSSMTFFSAPHSILRSERGALRLLRLRASCDARDGSGRTTSQEVTDGVRPGSLEACTLVCLAR